MADAGANPGAVRPLVAVSMGDPLGIGPEVVVKALADAKVRRRARFLVVGTGSALHEAAERSGIEPFWWRVGAGSEALGSAGAHDVVLVDHEADEEAAALAGRARGASRAGGALSFRFVDSAIAAARSGTALGKAQAVITAPISKEAWDLAGHGKWAGHTELFAARFGSKRTRMMFVAPELRVMLVTAHVPLMAVGGLLTIGRVHETIELGHEACVGLGIARPRIAVAGLNPHAGEAGKFGDEDGRIIAPAVELAREQGVDVAGPLPGDTVFGAMVRGKFDLVVAMYHDQGLIPVKLLAFDRAVNCTVGLPIVRTSPDHGTAFDIAGKGVADAGSMRAAVDLALWLVAGRR